MTQEDDIDGLAGEYVLGSLSADERRDVAMRRAHDRALDDAVAAWERRLAGLADYVPGAHPPAQALDAIAMRIWGQASPRAAPRHTIRRWRWATIAVGTLAAVLAIIVLAVQHLPGSPTTLVAVLEKSAAGHTADENADAKGPPAFVVTIDTKEKSIMVTPVSARPVAKRSYQLWLVAKAQPLLPLGVLAPSGPTTVPWPLAGQSQEQFDARALLGATLAVSLEPEGSFPDKAPTGPILFEGRLSAK